MPCRSYIPVTLRFSWRSMVLQKGSAACLSERRRFIVKSFQINQRERTILPSIKIRVVIRMGSRALRRAGLRAVTRCIGWALPLLPLLRDCLQMLPGWDRLPLGRLRILPGLVMLIVTSTAVIGVRCDFLHLLKLGRCCNSLLLLQLRRAPTHIVEQILHHLVQFCKWRKVASECQMYCANCGINKQKW
jgi:hypothetical protein